MHCLDATLFWKGLLLKIQKDKSLKETLIQEIYLFAPASETLLIPVWVFQQLAS